MAFDSRLNRLDVIYVDRITILTFIKLFEIRIVASNSFGLVRSLSISLSFLPDLTLSDSRSEGESEKNAVSDPEIRPEKNNSITNTIKAMIVSVLNPKKNCSEMFNKVIKESASVSSKIIYSVCNTVQNYKEKQYLSTSI